MHHRESADLDPPPRTLIEEELDKRYLTSIVKTVISIRSEYGTSYWDLDTDRGKPDFVVQNVSENALWPADRRLLLIDVDGNRFEVPNVDELGKRSQRLIDGLL